MNKITILIKEYKYDIILLISIIIMGAKHTYNLPRFIDISLSDEAGYLHNGVNIFKIGVHDVNYAPLYSFYYYILSLISNDKIFIHSINYIIITVSIPLISYVFFRSHDIKRIPSFIFSSILLVSQVNLNMWPKVSLFSLLLILSGGLIIRNARDDKNKFFAFCLIVYMVSFVRPEFMLSFILIFTAFIFYAVIDSVKYSKNSSFLFLIFMLCIIISTYTTIGLPIISSGGDRSLMAFGQHFSLNWVNWTESGMDPWTNWEIIYENSFGSSDTVLEAFIANPSTFVRHIISNIFKIPGVILGYLRYEINLLLPRNIGNWIDLSIVLFFSFVFLIRKVSIEKLFANLKAKENLFSLSYLLVLSIPCIISSVIIYPRTHYMLPLFLLILTIVGILISEITREIDKVGIYVVFALAFIFMVPCLDTYFPQQYYLPNKAIVTYIRNLNITNEVNSLDIDGYGCYLGDNYKMIGIWEKIDTFDKFMRDRNINMIIVTPELFNNYRYINDMTWNKFIRSYNTHGFVMHTIPGSNKFLLLKSSLL